VYLRIVSLTNDSITLGLNEARLTLHFEPRDRRRGLAVDIFAPRSARAGKS